jgi:hypothetical protein
MTKLKLYEYNSLKTYIIIINLGTDIQELCVIIKLLVHLRFEQVSKLLVANAFTNTSVLEFHLFKRSLDVFHMVFEVK